MPFPINTKRIVWAGSIAGALLAIGGMVNASVPTARGIVNSGPLPLAGKDYVDTQVAALSAIIIQLQKNNRDQAAQDAVRDKELATALQRELESELAGARNDYAKSPNNSTRQYMCGLIIQVNQQRAVNGLPPTPPCQ